MDYGRPSMLRLLLFAAAGLVLAFMSPDQRST